MDIVERLRDYANCRDVSVGKMLTLEAADEIERLRGALHQITTLDGYRDLPDAQYIAECALEQFAPEKQK